jgi:hypothetical protein
MLGGSYINIGQPERWVELCRAQLARGRDTHAFTRACLVVALTVAGSGEEARAAAHGLIDAAEATRNPNVLAFALMADGVAFCDADRVRALEALRRGLVAQLTSLPFIAQVTSAWTAPPQVAPALIGHCHVD